MKPETLSLGQILIDPNNYRFIDLPDYKMVSEKRFHEATVQNNTETLIEKDGRDELRVLKESVLTNGYIPLERIVVTPYLYQEGRYLVVEGNRRIVAMRRLVRDAEHGVDVPLGLVKSFEEIPCIILEPSDPDFSLMRQTLMGLRHISGIKEWGGYQSAKLLVEIVNTQNVSIADAASRIGLDSREAKRRYRAFQALSQMQANEDFRIYYEPKMYRLFLEALDQARIRAWLGWSEGEYAFTNEQNLTEFYKLN